MKVPTREGWLYFLVGSALFLLALLELAVASTCTGLGIDSGVYLSTAWAQTLGYKLYEQVACSYPPGVPVIYSFLGPQVCNPLAAHALLYSTHLANCLLLYLIIRTLNLSRSTSYFLTAIYITWVIHLDGLILVLEPFQNFFLLAAFLSYRKTWCRRASFAVGSLLCLSIMMKQFSILFFPVFGYAALSGGFPDEKKPLERWERLNNLWLFILGLILPYVFYVLAAEQNFKQLFIHLATFGSTSYYKGQGAVNYASLETATTTGPLAKLWTILVRFFQPTYMLAPGLLGVVVLLSTTRTRLARVIAALYALSLAPMFLRGYLHYAQLPAPWQILVAAMLLSRSNPKTGRWRHILAGFLILCASPFLYINLKIARSEWADPSLEHELALARRIQEIVPEGKSLSLERLGYLYPLTQRSPPDWNFEASFYDATESKADYVAVFSKGLTSDENEIRQRERMLAGGKFTHVRSLPYDDKAFRVGRILFFRRQR